MNRRAIIILTVASVIITLSAGVRQSFGLYLPLGGTKVASRYHSLVVGSWSPSVVA